MKNLIILPNQLFKNIFDFDGQIIIIEHPHFFTRLNFHKQKLIMHRASMQDFYHKLKAADKKVCYVEYPDYDLKSLLQNLSSAEIYIYDPLENEILTEFSEFKQITILDSPNFFNSRSALIKQFKDKKQILMNSFYIRERKRLNILLNDDGQPLGGSWSYDSENREPLPKDFAGLKKPKAISSMEVEKAIIWVNKNFSGNYGNTDYYIWPINHEQAEKQFDNFLKYKLANFGKYQDAVWQNDPFLFHTYLSSSINIGLLDPKKIIKKLCSSSVLENNSLASIEGLIRQIIGWREFMFGIYATYDKLLKIKGQKRQLPKSFWNGTTGIEPLDVSINQLLETGYLHHIYRLMFFGNFMFISNIDPHDVYRWFSELFIDAYNWVMFPNVYGMSQYCLDVKIVTKPYFSSSAYILKMSNFKKGAWCQIWDALFWKFVADHQEILITNNRLAMMVNTFNRFTKEKQDLLIKTAQIYLDRSSKN
jgi:deoxyribodipyrimidine photolyase-related protein